MEAQVQAGDGPLPRAPVAQGAVAAVGGGRHHGAASEPDEADQVDHQPFER